MRLAGVLTAALFVAIVTAEPVTAQSPTGDALAFAEGDAVTIEMGDGENGTATVVVLNPRSTPIYVHFSLLPPVPGVEVDADPPSLPTGYTSVTLSISVPSGTEVDSVTHLVVSGDPLEPATTPVAVSSPTPSTSPWWLLGAPAVLAVFAIAGGFWRAVRKTPSDAVVWWWNRMGPASWSFDKSWASTLTAAVAAASAVSASALLPDDTRFYPKDTYVGVSLVAGIAVIAAPLLYRALSRTAHATDYLPDQDAPGEFLSLTVDGTPWDPVAPGGLKDAGPDATQFEFDPRTGTMRFGDGVHGQRPADLSELCAKYKDTRTNRIHIERAYAPPPLLLVEQQGWRLSAFAPPAPADQTVEYQGFVATFLLASALTLAAVVVQLSAAVLLSLELESDGLSSGFRPVLAAFFVLMGVLAIAHGARSTADNIRYLGSVPAYVRPPDAISATQTALERLTQIIEAPSLSNLPQDATGGERLLWCVAWLLDRLPLLPAVTATTSLAVARLIFGVDRPVETDDTPAASAGAQPWTVL